MNQLPGDWVTEGLCAQVGGDLWYPEVGDPYMVAKKLCLKCEVIEQCAEFAIRTRQPEGIWGGMSARERSKLWRAA